MKFCLTGLFLLLGSSCFAQSAEEILQKYFAIVSNGDIKNWDKIQSVRVESEVFYNHQESQGSPLIVASRKPGQYHRVYRQWPDKLKTEIYEDSTYSNLLSYTLWRADKKKLIHWFNNVPSSTVQIEEVKWDFQPLFLYKQVKNSKSIEYKGIKNLENNSASYFVIEVRTKAATFHLYLNTESYLLEYSMSPDGSDYIKFYDYQTIDGFVFNMSYYATKNGSIFFGYRNTKIDINYPIDPNVFKEPDQGRK